VDIFLKVARWIKYVSNRPWSELRAVTNSPAAKATVLIPIIGYLIIFNENVIKYLHVATDVGGTIPPEGHVSSRLLLVYLGLMFIAVGAAAYQLFCPADVKHYGDTNAYVGGVTSTIKDYRFRTIEDRLRNSIFHERYMHIRDMYAKTWQDRDLNDDQKAAINNGILHLYFEYLNKEHAPMRMIAGWAFLIGFVILSIPSIGVFARVLRLIFKTIYVDPTSFV
jgi:hypothetical protein